MRAADRESRTVEGVHPTEVYGHRSNRAVKPVHVIPSINGYRRNSNIAWSDVKPLFFGLKCRVLSERNVRIASSKQTETGDTREGV